MALLKRLLASFFQLFRRSQTLSSGTIASSMAGPAPDEYPVVTAGDIVAVHNDTDKGMFMNGKWLLAQYKEMHPGRIGRGIIPKTLVVHTTDMRPGTFAALVKSWTSQQGKGNGAHFLIGKTDKDGVVQFAPITRNANHAGGPESGHFRLPDGALIHPNTAAVGVELDNAGRLKKDAEGWYHPDTGHRFAAEDVFIDDKGRGWEKLTDYQVKTLVTLWIDLKPCLKPWPAGTTVAPSASYESQGAGYAKALHPRLVGHASLNPVRKSDPGTQAMNYINKWSAKDG